MRFLRKHRQSLEFATVISFGIALHVFSRVFILDISLGQAIFRAVVSFVCAFVFLAAAVILCGRWRRGDIEVSPWFAWFVAGSMGLFWVGVVVSGRLYGGLLTVFAWGALLFVLWIVLRTRRSQQLARHDRSPAAGGR